jgi:DNA-binding transcriptional ArsR family regulator
MNSQLYSPENETVLLEAFGRTPELRLIDFFMDNMLFDFTRGEIIEALGMNKRTLYRTLPKLEEMNVVEVSRKIEKAKLYKVNRESTIVACLRSIEKELSLKELSLGRQEA